MRHQRALCLSRFIHSISIHRRLIGSVASCTSISIMAISRRNALCVLLLLAIVAGSEAAKIETFNGLDCNEPSTNVFYTDCNTCTTFFDQSSVLVTEISANQRVSFHNQQDCEPESSVGQQYGPVCANQGHTKLRAVWIAC